MEDFVAPAENDVWGLGPPRGEIPSKLSAKYAGGSKNLLRSPKFREIIRTRIASFGVRMIINKISHREQKSRVSILIAWSTLL